MYTFVPNKPFGSLLEISPTNHIFLKTFNSEYDGIKVWFTDQNSQPLEIEVRVNFTMVIKWRLYKWDIQLNQGYGFLSFAKTINKNLSNKYGQKLLDSSKASTTDAIKTPSKRAIQKTAQAIGDFIDNENADKIRSVSKKSTKELPKDETEVDVARATPKKRYTSPEERQ